MSDQSWLESLLSLEAAQFGRGPGAEIRDTIRRLASRSAARGIAGASAARQIDTLNGLVFSELGLRFRWSSPSRDFALIPTLRDRAGNCLGLTTAYVALAQALELPVQALLFERHMAAAYVGIAGPLHIETSRAGVVLCGQSARRMHGTRAGRLLQDEELLAVHLSNMAAFILIPAGQSPHALGLLDAAVTLFPDYVAAWVNRGALLISMGRTGAAADAMERALNLDPGPQTLRTIHRMADMLGREDGERIRSLIP